MALKQYVRYEQDNGGFIRHLFSRDYFKALATITWGFIMFALALNLSVGFFSNKLEGSVLASAQHEEKVVENGEVQGAVVESVDEYPTPTVASVDEQKDIVENTSRSPRKASYKVAVFGDSMIDTMGTKVQALQDSLKKKYPSTVFLFYNYGEGAENVERGLSRFDKPFISGDRNYPPLTTLGADIIILGSYAYNPFSPFDRDKHWIMLSNLVEKAKATNAEVYLLADIAPVRAEFGRGPKGANWDSVTAYEKSGQVIQLLENTVGISKNLNVILVNAFEKSTVTVRGDGKREYVSTQDGIHPSDVGQKFVGEQIANTLVLD